MGDNVSIPELKQVLGAMIFGAGRPLSVKDMLDALKSVAAESPETGACFSKVRESDINSALEELAVDVETARAGFRLREIGKGFRFLSDESCGEWLRRLLNLGKPNRLSLPALETLAIIAYRQPITRGRIEEIRGVSVDHMVRTLMELQLIRIVGRSELPGKPFLYGTTKYFLEHFGLRSVEDLGGIEPALRKAAAELDGCERVADERADEASGGEPAEEESVAPGQDQEQPVDEEAHAAEAVFEPETEKSDGTPQ